jgi:hypothetical protein
MPPPTAQWQDFPEREVRLWLTDDVCPFLHKFARRLRFREEASWPLRVLARGAQTAERQLVERVDAAIVKCAKSISELARLKTIRRRLETFLPPRPRITREDVQVSGDGCKRIDVQTETVDEIPFLLSQLDSVARRFWTDLVCADDYFEPRGGWNSPGQPPGQSGVFIVSFNPELHPGGDFVSRCLIRRVEVLHEILHNLFVPMYQACQEGTRFQRRAAEIEQDWQSFTDLASELRHKCIPEIGQPRRDACVLLTQVYAAFTPQPDLFWLNLSEEVIRHGKATFRHRITSGRNVELADRIAIALTQVASLYEECQPGQSAFEEAIAAGGLVLRDNPPTLYWEGKKLAVSWASYSKPWLFINALAAKARLGAAVNDHDVYGDTAVSNSTLATLYTRLKNLVPASLWREIKPGTEARTYRLCIEPSRIFLSR